MGGMVERLEVLERALVTCARLSALALLGEETTAAKEARARDVVLRIEQAWLIADVALRYYQARPACVAWEPAHRPDLLGLVASGRVAMAGTRTALAAAADEAAAAMAAVSDGVATSPLLAPISLLLAPISATLGPAAGPPAPSAPTPAEPPAGPTRVFAGPCHVGLDPLFAPSLSLLDPGTTRSMESHRAPSSWCLSIREEMAAELCALSLVEYDGLPLAFYRDFAKQAWDELRHAQFFLRVGLDLLPDFLATAPPDHPLLPGARRFHETGSGLPVPREGNLYELTWNTTLAERLILMHHDTETPGLASFAEDLRSAFYRAHPALAAELSLAAHDEASHAKLGRTWLAHLFPDEAARQAAIERTRVLRGILLLAAMSHHHEAPLGVLAEKLGGAASTIV